MKLVQVLKECHAIDIDVFSYLRFPFDQAHLTVSVFGRPRNSLEKKGEKL